MEQEIIPLTGGTIQRTRHVNVEIQEIVGDATTVISIIPKITPANVETHKIIGDAIMMIWM